LFPGTRRIGEQVEHRAEIDEKRSRRARTDEDARAVARRRDRGVRERAVSFGIETGPTK
jgi:hypothetical protein